MPRYSHGLVVRKFALFAAYLGVAHEMVDAGRAAFNISARTIRSDLESNRNWLHASV